MVYTTHKNDDLGMVYEIVLPTITRDDNKWVGINHPHRSVGV